MAKFIPIILPQPGEDLRTWARQLTSQLQSLTAQLSSVLANIEVTEGGGIPTPGGTTTPVKTPDGTTVLDVQGYYIDGLGRVIVDATGFHVYDLVGFQVIDGPNVYINTEHLVENAVKTAQLANDAVTYEKFFPDLVPIKVVDTLPNPVGYTGPGVVWLSTDLKLYRHAGTAWTSAVPAVDITGQLTNAQLESIAAAKLTGQIVETQIADDSISTPKLAAGSVSTAKLAAGAVVADTIAANAVTAVKLATNAVEADKIAANAVTTSKLDANAVTTEKLDALAVTAGKLAAGSVVAGKLAANAIVANDGVIANAAIANAQIVDLNANKITAGSIAAERMEANIVTALNGKFATLSALASSLGIVQILPGGALLTQGAINYSTGTGVYVDAAQLRIGNPAGARLQWTGSALEIYNSSNQLTIASGEVNWAGITGTGKPENGATVGADSSNLRAGRGVNLLFNAGLSLSAEGFDAYGGTSMGLNHPGWCIKDGGAKYGTHFIHGTASVDGAFYVSGTTRIPVIAGKRYEAYAYTGAHRCTVTFYIDFYNSAGTNIGNGTNRTFINGGVNDEQAYGGTSLVGYRQIGEFCTAPEGAATARLIVWKGATKAGHSDSWLFTTLPYFGEAGAAQTEPSPWVEGASSINTQITPSNVTTYIANAAIGNAQIGNAAITNANIANATILAANIANAQINTLHVGPDQITVPRYIESSAAVSTPTSGSWYEVLSFNSFPALGAPVLLFVTIDSSKRTRLLRNGFVLYDFEVPKDGTNFLILGQVSFMVYDSDPGDYPNYTVQIYRSTIHWNSSTYDKPRKLAIFAMKR